MKRLICTLLAAVMLLTALPLSATAQEVPTSFYIYSALDEYESDEPPTPVDAAYWEAKYHIYNRFDSESGTLYIYGNTGIPDFYLSPDRSRTEFVGERWKLYYQLNNEHLRLMGELVKKIVICDGITGVGAAAFADVFDSVETVIVAGSVKYINYRAFSGMKNLKSLQLSQGIESISGGAFAHADALTEATLPSTLRTFGAAFYPDDNGDTALHGLFDSCKNLKKIISLNPSLQMNVLMACDCPSLTTLVLYGPMADYQLTENCPKVKDIYVLSNESGNNKFKNIISYVEDAKHLEDEYYNQQHEDEPNYKPQSEFYYRIAPLYKNVTVHCYSDSDAYQLAKACEAKKVRLLDAPAKVSGLKVKKTTYNSVTVIWSANKSRTTYYEVQRYLNSYHYWKTVATVKGKTSCTVNNLMGLDTYQFRVRAVNKSAYSLQTGAFSKIIKATTQIAPVTVYDTATLDDGRLYFNYSKSHNCTDYEIYLKKGKNGKFKKLATTKKTTYTTKKYPKGTYYVKVRARKKTAKGKYTCSAFSPEKKIAQ